jgi:hypothetical protein
MHSDKNRQFSPTFIFVAYIVTASLLILGFRFLFPGEDSPLPFFSSNWRLLKGIINIITLFPALAFTAIVIPFGMVSNDDIDNSKMLSRHLFQYFTAPIITAICAAVFYAMLFILVLPLAQNSEENMRFQGELYRQAKERAETHRNNGEWIQASQFIVICDSLWKNSPELDALRGEIDIHLGQARFNTIQPERNQSSAGISAIPFQREPVDAGEAITMSETALNEGRFFDAHWLATVGGRIAREGSPETTTAARLAALAWNQMENQQLGSAEIRAHSLYRLKLSGYEAMVSGDWIRAFFIFQEYAGQNPNDPDLSHFLPIIEKGTTERAFFIDEIEMLVGETFSNTIFSLPVNNNTLRRSVMRISNLSTSPDFAYGIGIEYIVFDSQARPLFSLQAPYAKFLPITINDQHHVLVLMRALDRRDSTKNWEPEWNFHYADTYNPEGNFDPREFPDDAQIILTLSYEVFLLLSQLQHGLPGLSLDKLFSLSRIANLAGYVPQVYEIEILNRLGALFFLPMAIFFIALGWNFRARQRTTYLFIPLLLVLPLVFYGVTFLYRILLNIIGSSLVLILGFSVAFPLFIVFLVVSFILSLIILAIQRE